MYKRQITIFPEGISLDEVQITAEKSETTFTLDKRVFNVGKDLTSKGGTAQDVLDNVPSVSVDVEGNVSLRGSEGVRILINGQPSGLVGISDADGLRSLPAQLIDKVEVITNPSSRYEAEGSAGIINIVLKEEREGGFNGSFDLTTGDPYKLGLSSNLNYRSGKLNYFLTYAIRKNTSFGRGETYKELYGDDETIVSFENRDFERNGLSHTFRGGLGYQLEKNSTLTLSGVYRYSEDDNFNTVTYQDYFIPVGESFTREGLAGADIILRNDIEGETEPTREFNINYDKRLGQGHTLRARLSHRSQDETETSLLEELLADENLAPLDDPYLNQRSSNAEGEKSTVFNIDYVKPIGDRVVELGMRSSFRNVNNNYLVEELMGDEWTNLTDFSNDFKYDEDVHAAYFIFGEKKKKFSYQLGLRAEHSNVRTELVQTSELNDRSYTNLFPSAFFNYSFTDTDGIQVSYSKRIRRPRFRSLNPFFSFTDVRNFFSGNPNLDPTFSDNYELGYIKYWDKGSLTSSVYYRHSTGNVERIRTLNDDGFTFTTNPQNLSTQNNYGFEFVGQLSPWKWWRLDGNLNLFRSITDGQLGDQVFDADTYSWSSRLTSRFTFWNRSNLQLRYNYRGGRETTQGTTDGIGTMDVAFSKDFYNDNMTFTLNVRDVFNGRKRNGTTFGEGFFTDGFFQWRVRDISLTVSYRLNMKKQRERRERGGGDEGGDFEGGEF